MTFKDVIKKSVLDNFSSQSDFSLEFLVPALVAIAFSLLIGILIYKIYSHFFGGVVFSRSFAVTLVGMSVLTCIITLAISSNLVISLGMVGALSIIRYRTAIKDPLDLLYLFWAVTTGIVCGAKLYALATLAFLIMTVVIFLFYSSQKSGTIFILIVHYDSDQAGDQIERVLNKIRHQTKSKTYRGERVELTIELHTKGNSTTFMENIRAIEGVQDASLIQYNGEYHG